MLSICSTSVLIRHLWQLNTIVFLHWCLICVVLLKRMVLIKLSLFPYAMANSIQLVIIPQNQWSSKIFRFALIIEGTTEEVAQCIMTINPNYNINFIFQNVCKNIKSLNKNIENVYQQSKFKISCWFDKRPHWWKSKQFAQKFQKSVVSQSSWR